MSFGIFEAAVAGDKENEHQKKLAKTRLAQAAAEVDQKLGPFLSKATSKSDYIERVRLAENDFREIVGKYLEGDTGFKAVATKMASHYVRTKAAAKNLHMLDDMQVLNGYATVASGLEEGWGVDEGMTQEDLQEYADELERRGIDPYNNDVYSSRRHANGETHFVHDNGVVEVFDADAYLRENPNADIVTDGYDGRMWDDSVVTGLTPAPSARSPFEYDRYSSRRRRVAGPKHRRLDEGAFMNQVENVYDHFVTELFENRGGADGLERKDIDGLFDDFVNLRYPDIDQGVFDTAGDYVTDQFEADRFAKASSRLRARRSRRRRAASRRKEATPWEEGSEPQFTETGWGEYVMEYGDYSAAVQEDGSWAVVHNGRVVGEGEGNGDPDDSFGEVEQWFKKNASKRKGARLVKKARRPVRFIHEPGTQGSSFASPIAVFPDSWQDTGRYDSSDGGQYQILGPSWQGEDNPGDVYPGSIIDSWEETEDMDWARKTFPKIFDSDEYEIVTKNSSRKAAVTEEEAAEAFYRALGPDFDLRDLNDPNMPKEMADPLNDIARSVARDLGVSEYDLWDAVSFHPPRTGRLASGPDVYNHPDVGELHVTFYNDGTAVVTSPEVGEVGSIRVMPDDGADEIEEQLNILVDEVRYASKKTAGEYLSPGDLEDHGAQIFFNQYADSHGIDTYGEDYDRMWNDIMESVGYDVISADLDTAVEHGELSSAVGSRLQWDLEDFYGFGTGALFSSKKTAGERPSMDEEVDWLNNANSGTTIQAWDPRGGEETEDGDYTGEYIKFVKTDSGKWYNNDYRTDLSAEELAGNEVEFKRSRRQKQAEWGKERFPGTNEMFERAGWQSTDPEKSEWLSPSGYAMYDGSTGSAYYFDPDDNVSSFYTLEDEEFRDDLPKVLTDDEEYQSRLWEY